MYTTSFATYSAILLSFLSFISATPSDTAIGAKLQAYSLFPRDLPTGTCNAQTPCVNSACCGTNGLCGYSPSECGQGNCTSNCDAKAECGQYGTPGKQECPLGVCCSKFGFCGSTDDFCGTGCQSDFGGCGPPKRPSCGTGSGTVGKRTVGYYESWSSTRKCQTVMPEDLNLQGYTHINFAFASFDPSSFAIAPMDDTSGQLFNRFTDLKNKHRDLQTWISVGGWSFTDPGPTRTAFSTMSSSQGGRASFISQLMHFMDTYGFDGVDLDWEYPQADDRGGVQADTANYVLLVSEMRAAFGSKYGISMTLPTSYWYLQHFDLKGIQPHVDWFNLMSYDLHGTWDAASKFLGPILAPHTNITEIDLGLDLLWRAGVSSDKVVLGQAYYGRSFTLTDPSCSTPNGVCQFSSGADAGPCSNAAGILDNQEIQDIISQNNLKPSLDTQAGVKWITWNSNQWVSYDDADTFKLKRDFANDRCLGGLMVWAMDQVDQKSTSDLITSSGVTDSQQADADQKSQDLAAGISCRTTDCDQKCPKGTNQVAQVGGQPGQLSTSSQCPAGKYRNVCCNDGTFTGICTWRGYRGAGLSCVKGCLNGETEVLTDTKWHDKHGDTTCSGGLQSYCCKGFKSAPTKKGLEKEAGDLAISLAEQAAEQVAIDIAAKAFCRIAVPALLAPLELLEDLIPIVGEILDIAEIAATPALIDLCTKQVEKEGKAELKVFGKDHTINGFTKPTAKPTSRPPESTHTKPSTSKTDACPRNEKRADNGECEGRPQRAVQSTTTAEIKYELLAAETVTCNYNRFSQACLGISSAIRYERMDQRVTCPYKRPPEDARPALTEYNRQRDRQWSFRIDPMPKDGCDRDEWPPAMFIRQNDGLRELGGKKEDLGSTPQRIRLIPAADNRGAGSLLGCPPIAKNSDDLREHPRVEMIEGRNGKIPTRMTYVTITYTRRVYVMTWNMAGYVDDGDNGLRINSCQPPAANGEDYRGYAVLNEDGWWNRGNNRRNGLPERFAVARDRKRDLGAGLIGAFGGNSTSRTDESADLFAQPCEDSRCTRERKEYGDDIMIISRASQFAGNPRASELSPAEITSTSRPSMLTSPSDRGIAVGQILPAIKLPVQTML